MRRNIFGKCYIAIICRLAWFFPERLGNRALGGNVQARGTSSADVRDVNHGSRCRRVALSLDPWPSSRFLSAGLVSLADYAKV